MEDKEDRIEVGAFFDALEKELGMDNNKSKHALVESKPLLPKRQAYQRPTRPHVAPQVNSIKIQRKTPLDYMIRKNQEMKSTQNKKLPTYSDYQQKYPPKSNISYQKKPQIPSRSNPRQLTPRQTLNKQSQPSESTLYPRYTIPNRSKPQPKQLPTEDQDKSYLRAQMLKELRSQQQKQPVNLSRGRLKPPSVVIPPQPSSPSYPPQIQSTPNRIATPNEQFDTYYPEEAELDYISEYEMMNCLQQIRDKTKIDVLIHLLDGKWHNESELLRIAKKTRDFIGVVGFGMLMCSFEDSVTKSFLKRKVNSENSSWYKINENFVQLARSAYSQYKTEEK